MNPSRFFTARHYHLRAFTRPNHHPRVKSIIPMVSTIQKPEFEEIRPGIKVPAKETILTPRFYTTDF
ncbi:MAG: magnesium-protoporphyrin IX monomethyl ester cyclase, partial [Microcystis sp.]